MTIKLLPMNRPFAFGRQRGATLLEAIAFLGIAGIIIVGAISLLTRAFGSASSNRTIEQYQAIHTNVRKLYSAQPNYNGINFTTLRNAGAYPSTLRMSSTTVANSWGGAVNVAAAGQDDRGFSVSFAEVPSETCVELVAALSLPNWSTVTVGGQSRTVPVTPSTAAADCGTTAQTVQAISPN